MVFNHPFLCVFWTNCSNNVWIWKKTFRAAEKLQTQEINTKITEDLKVFKWCQKNTLDGWWHLSCMHHERIMSPLCADIFVHSHRSRTHTPATQLKSFLQTVFCFPLWLTALLLLSHQRACFPHTCMASTSTYCCIHCSLPTKTV